MRIYVVMNGGVFGNDPVLASRDRKQALEIAKRVNQRHYDEDPGEWERRVASKHLAEIELVGDGDRGITINDPLVIVDGKDLGDAEEDE